VTPPDWFSKGSLPPWAFQLTGIALFVYVVVKKADTDVAILVPGILAFAGIIAFDRWAGGRPAPRARDDEAGT
jgi:hypothetical protein